MSWKEPEALQQIPIILAELVGMGEPTVDGSADQEADLVIHTGGLTFVVEFRSAGDTVSVEQGTRHLLTRTPDTAHVPLLVVPFMGPAGRELCGQREVNWLDLSGNADIKVPGRLRVLVHGRPNAFKRRGRPSNLFAPKASRLTRHLLMHPGARFTQRGLAQDTRLDEGYISKLVSRMERKQLVTRSASGAVSTSDIGLLLDAWLESYQFDKHHIFRGHLASRSGVEALATLSDRLRGEAVPHAATGLGAAWQYDRFASFRLVTFFIEERVRQPLLTAVGVREVSQGANVWLVTPNDEGVFDGSRDIDGVRCVNPIQAYVDLKAHPERAAEAAVHLRDRVIGSPD